LEVLSVKLSGIIIPLYDTKLGYSYLEFYTDYEDLDLRTENNQASSQIGV